MIIMIANFFQRAVNVDILPSRSKSKKNENTNKQKKSLIKAKVKANRPKWVSVGWFLLKKLFVVFFEITFFDGRSVIRKETRENEYSSYKDIDYEESI